MLWSELYDSTHRPTQENFCDYVGNDLWQQMNAYLQETYNVSPLMAYSHDVWQKGWNVKYRKRGRSLCTLYPMQGYFIALVVVGKREIDEAELLIPFCGEYIKALFHETVFGYSGKWMMVEVKSADVMDDLKKLIAIRAK